MRDFINIGSAPAEEQCVQVNKEGNYHKAMRAECVRFIEQLRRVFGPEPEGAQLGVKSFPHDFGLYLEVVCYFENNDEEARKWAFRLEDEMPARWDQPLNTPPVRRPTKVCDDCLTAAWDMGIPDRASQIDLMVTMGADVEDHLCSMVEAPDIVTSCACACRRK